MNKKIFSSIIIITFISLATAIIIILASLYNYFGNISQMQLQDELSIAAIGVEDDGISYLSKLSSDNYRLTWISSDGKVIYDTTVDPTTADDHSDRKEFIEAINTGHGDSIRYSSTMMLRTMYHAVKLSDGSILRISRDRATVGALLIGMIQPIIIISIVVIILAWIVGTKISHAIVSPLNNLDLEHPLDNDTYEEISPLLHAIDVKNKKINTQLDEIRRRSNEFMQITSSMQEALVLIDRNGMIISINPAGKQLYDTDDTCIGHDFVTVDRNRDIYNAMQLALRDGHAEVCLQRDGLTYQFDISRIESDDELIGCVILAFDITARELAEQRRREFTANVSHELKTPLQSIMGSAELLEKNMAKEEDVPRFASYIKEESQRLVTLIDDIIRLSSLDENDGISMEDISLLDISDEVIETLSSVASKRNIHISLSGSDEHIEGSRALIYEIIYNLCDNAIKYNKNNGDISIDISHDEYDHILIIKDTGIGIPIEHQSRIFERFYRVDKSHSKSSGGTGLGLSIVKHAVAYHHGTISVSSDGIYGTTMIVRFPR